MSAAPIKVLVIDDEPPIRKLLRMGLTTQGYEILEASNGKIALEKLVEEPALIILDLGLPDVQGHELLRTIRARNEGVPIVVLSSRGDEAGKVQALDLGADDYLTKPFGMDELLARLRAALRHQLQVQGERPVFRSGDLSVDLVRQHRQGRRARGEAVAEGIRPPARAGAARRQGAHPPLPAEGALGRIDRRAILTRLCPPAPPEDRSRPGAAAICADRDGDRVPVEGGGLGSDFDSP
ncbi:CheY-like chemotaxis protein [Bradyrhizobium ottawaense]